MTKLDHENINRLEAAMKRSIPLSPVCSAKPNNGCRRMVESGRKETEEAVAAWKVRERLWREPWRALKKRRKKR